ncbi:MAG: hypothetical protein WCG11_10310 [Methylococcaceae bacterium]|jgi:hypothetical protein
MNEEVLTKAKADLKLNLLNAEAESLSSSDLYMWLIDSGLSSEVAIRLKNFADVTENVTDHAISIGKIVLLKIVDFIKLHPNLAIGIAVGAAIGALVSLIPFLGVYLAPVVASISATIGAIAGHRIDKIEQGQTVNTSTDIIAIGQDAIEIAKEFFKLLAEIFNAVFNEQVLSFRV